MSVEEDYCNELCTKPITGYCNVCELLQEADQFVWRWFRGGLLWETLNWFLRPYSWWRVIELLGIMAGIVALSFTGVAMFYDVMARQEEREGRAWDVLITKAPGNIGQTQAIQYLNAQSSCFFRNRWLFLKEWDQSKFLSSQSREPWSRFEGESVIPKLHESGWRGVLKYGLGFERIDMVSLLPDRPWKERHQCVLRELNLWFFWCSPSWWPINRRIPLREIDLTPIGYEPAKDDECFEETYLRKVDLACANLDRAVLPCSNLREADLRDASLKQADMRKSNLFQADLRNANLEGANLQGADLQGAKLKRANLKGADLRGVKLVVMGGSRASVTAKVAQRACRELQQAVNWQDAYRDKALACEKPRPNPPEYSLPW